MSLTLLLAVLCAGCGNPGDISKFRCEPGVIYNDGAMCVPYKSPGDQCIEGPVYDPACPPKYMCGYKNETGVFLSISPTYCVPEGFQISQFVAPMCTVYLLKQTVADNFQTVGSPFVLRQGTVAWVAQGEKIISQKIDPNTGVVLEEQYSTEVTVLAYDCGGMSVPPEMLVFNGLVFASGSRVVVRQAGKVLGKNGNPDTVYAIDRTGAPITVDGKPLPCTIVPLTKFGS